MPALGIGDGVGRAEHMALECQESNAMLENAPQPEGSATSMERGGW